MNLADLHVMLVEDHGFQRRLGLRLLADLGVVNLHEAADGIQGLELLRTLTHLPEVILVDLDMPGMDGVEFIGHIAQERLAKSIAVVSAMDPSLLHTVQVMAQASGSNGCRIPRRRRLLPSTERPPRRNRCRKRNRRRCRWMRRYSTN